MKFHGGNKFGNGSCKTTCACEKPFLKIVPMATVAVCTQKNFFTLLKHHQGSQGCQKIKSFFTNETLEKNHQKSMFSYSFLNIPQFGLNISAPNHQNIWGSSKYFDNPGIPGPGQFSNYAYLFILR